MTFRPPEDRWEPWHVEVRMVDGPYREYVSGDIEDTDRRPAGFNAWTVDPHPWCARHCTTPDVCDCPEPVTIGPHIELGCE